MSTRAAPGCHLSPAEEAVVRKVADGYTDKAIGRDLGKDHITVRDQVKSARRKFGARTRAHLVALWMKTRIW